MNKRWTFVLNSRFAVDPYLAQALGIVPYTAIGFLGSRFFAFRVREDEAMVG